MEERIIVWFRKDFRLNDHPALVAATQAGAIIPVFIWDEQFEGKWKMGAAAKWWLHHALLDMQEQFATYDLSFLIRQGRTIDVLQELAVETGASAVYFHERYDVYEQDQKVIEALQMKGIACRSFVGHSLLHPNATRKKNGEPYKVFTPFYKAFAMHTIGEPLLIPNKMIGVKATSMTVAALRLLPRIPWTSGMERRWTPTEAGAQAQLQQFTDIHLTQYEEGRDFPSTDHHSALAPYLAFGQLSPRTIYHRVQLQGAPFIRQLIWREFSYHLLFHFPHTSEKPMNEAFEQFPWEENEALFHLWSQGKTGYPFIDAGMRELWETGFMHNRVRMVAASFLVKHLLLPWQQGANWFWDTLLDADLANNTMGWQWVAGSGADAAPYFRIFNPITQGEKFDKQGDYVRKWIPELRNMPDRYIHKPWTAPKSVLEDADVILGITYPKPIVDHTAARERALAAYQQMKSS